MVKENQTAVVFGGSGFLGSHVADELTSRGYAVRIFDTVASPYLQTNQEMIVGDITDLDAVVDCVKGCDYVLNFASIADLSDASVDPARTAQVNVIGTVNSLEAARSVGVKRYVLASSVYVYSRAGGVYKASKQSSEAFVEAYQESFEVPYTILRYGSLYGRRAGNSNTIARFVEECLKSGSMTYYGTSSAVREYIHVRDAARLTVDTLAASYAQRNVLLTGSERLPVREVMQMIAEIAPKRPEIRIKDTGSDLHYSISPYNYQPRLGHKLISTDYVDLGQGILDCFEEFYENQSKENQLNP